MLPVLENRSILPLHQFGFRRHHSTPEQCHRIVKVISESIEEKKYCSAVFLDVQKAFDKVWHPGLLFKIKKLLPHHYFLLIKSYLTNRFFQAKVRDELSKILPICAGVPQGSVLGPVLYTLFTADMPVCKNVVVATYADDTAVVASSISPVAASEKVQRELSKIEKWLKKWHIRVNAEKSVHATFALRRGNCSPVSLNGSVIPHSDCVKYLGLHIDRRLTWKKHILAKRKQLNFKIKRLQWLLGSKSELSLENRLVIYKVFLKPIWTYGIQLWGTAKDSNVEILQRFQSKALRMVTKAPWFVSNDTIHCDLNMDPVKQVINKFSERYLGRLRNHDNPLAISLLDDTTEVRRLKRLHVLDLPFRNEFN